MTKAIFTLIALLALICAFIFSTFIPGANTAFPTFATALVAIATAFLTSHVASQHVDNLKDE